MLIVTHGRCNIQALYAECPDALKELEHNKQVITA